MSQVCHNHQRYTLLHTLPYTLQRYILGSLAVLWIAVLPWLCWGGWSNPHHPHSNPHFVFAGPPLLDAGHHVHPTDPLAAAEQDPLAGVARPDTLLIALLVLLLPMLRLATTPQSHHFTRTLATLWTHATAMAVPTPPPRPFLPIITV